MLVTGSSYRIVSIIVILQHRHLHQCEVGVTKRHTIAYNTPESARRVA